MVKVRLSISEHISLLAAPLASLSDKSSAFSAFISYPSNMDGLQEAMSNRSFRAEAREILQSVLNAQYNGIKLQSAVKENIAALADSQTFTITTGHQLCLAGGPLYFVIKMASAIKLAQELQKNNPHARIIPIFWMASEDHDVEEANHVFFRDKKYAYSWAHSEAVGHIPASVTQGLFEEWKRDFPELEMSAMWKDVEKAYAQSDNIADATRIFVDKWFGKYGLLCIDADRKELKSSFKEIMRRELRDSFSFPALEACSKALEKEGLTPQIQGREINLFYLGEHSRERIEKVSDTEYRIGERLFSTESLEEELDNHPERFSPNVVLRPLYQEYILPNIAYVGGPAEVKYWLQLKKIFEAAQVDFPVLIPRDNFLFLKEESLYFLEEHALTLGDLWMDEERLLNRWLEKNGEKNEEWQAWKQQMEELFESLKTWANPGKKVQAFIPAAQKEMENILKRLDLRMRRDLKMRHEGELRKLKKLREELFPKGNFQERHISVFEVSGLLGEEGMGTLIQYSNPLDFRLKILLWKNEKE